MEQANTSGRLFAIPDIHGRRDLLDALLDQLFQREKLDLSKDKLIFLGDMIDRGKDSKGVLDKIRSLAEANPETVIALAGNHEYLMLNACVRCRMHDFELWLINGGGETLQSFPGEKVDEDTLRWVAKLPLFHEEPGFFFSHAPVPKEEFRRAENRGKPFTLEELTWTYHDPETWISRDMTDEGKIGVCGHIHALRYGVMAPRFRDHYWFLDSGAGCSVKAPLVAVECRSQEVFWAWPIEAQGTRS